MFKKPAKPSGESGKDLEKWASQIRKGSLEMCLLGVIANQPRYGFEIVQHLNKVGGLTVTEGTLYPLLNRMQNEGLIEASWRESASGPPRKYYRSTEEGAAVFARMCEEWRRYAGAVEGILSRSEAEAAAEEPAGVAIEIAPKPR